MKKQGRRLVISSLALMICVGIFGKLFWSAPASEKPQTLLKDFDIRIFFGYKDARPARFVADRYEMAIFLQQLTDTCRDERYDCGFTRAIEKKSTGDGAQVFYKLVKDQQGLPFKIRLSVFSSSVGADDDRNRANPFQKWRSEYIKAQFTEALKEADVVFYNGHSRAGGGPDFSFPELTKGKHVHYDSYQKNKSGFHLIKNTLLENPHAPLKTMGLYSCKSDQLFRKQIELTRPQLKVIASQQLLYFSDAFNQSLDQLSQTLENL